MGDPEEIRLALALNGGVSLAIWMGGTVVELDAARRAHLGPEQLGDGRIRSVYSGICEALDRRVVADVMAGSSAGGINAALLAAAAQSGRRLHPDFLREEWIRLGDFEFLMQPKSKAGPASLLQGGLFHESLLEIFGKVLGQGTTDQRNALCPAQQASAESSGESEPVPTIEITATDLSGEIVEVRDVWGASLKSRDFEARFRFSKANDYSADRLATAARSSASFPVAFEPWWVHDEGLTGLSEARWMIDGGLLNNAPIKTALDLIPTRRARRPVRRLLCYINPDPAFDEKHKFRSDPEIPVTSDAVLSRSLSILRGADTANHLRDVQRAVQPPSMFEWREERLLAVGLDALEQTAVALVPTYNLARIQASYEEMTGVPPRPETVFGENTVFPPWLKATESGLPYARVTPEENDQGTVEWGLGMRAAQRALHFCVDALRRGLVNEPDQFKDAAAAAIDSLVSLIEVEYANPEFRDSLGRAMIEGSPDSLQDRFSSSERLANDAVLRGAWLLWLALEDPDAENESREGSDSESGQVDPSRQEKIDEGFFGPSSLSPRPGSGRRLLMEYASAPTNYRQRLAQRTALSMFSHDRPFRYFIRRMQAIEVVRRAGGTAGPDIETAAEIDFVQLTPSTQSPIMATPGNRTGGPVSAEEKLCGIRWGHFAGFYKRSWRVNDYMWGRLDGAARAVDVLFDGKSRLSCTEGQALADSLLPKTASEETRWIVGEELGLEILDDTSDARRILSEYLLRVTNARRVCTKLAQLEVLSDEIDHLVQESGCDRVNGAGVEPLQIEGETLKEKIISLRSIRDLPGELGRDQPAETSSDLAFRTASSAMFVALSGASVMNRTFGKILGLFRPALYAFSGTVAKSLWHRIAVVVGFVAAGSYLAARAVEVNPAIEPEIGSLFTVSTFVALIAVLIIVGLLVSPLLRYRARVNRPINSLIGALVLIGAGVTAILPGWGPEWLGGGVPVLTWFLAPEVDILPNLLGVLIALVLTGVALAAVPRSQSLTWLTGRPWAGLWTLALLMLVAVASLVFTLPALVRPLELGGPWPLEISDTWGWRETLSVLALLSYVGFAVITWLAHRTRKGVPRSGA